MMPIAMIVVLLICLVSPAAATAQDTSASTNVAKEDPQFLIFEWKDKQPYPALGDWLRRNRAVFDHADYCALTWSAIDVGPHSSHMGTALNALTSFLVLRDVNEYDLAGRTFHDEHSGLDLDVYFECDAAVPPGHGNGKGYPAVVVMSLSVLRGKDDAQEDIGQAQAMFLRDKTWWKNGLTLRTRALVGDTLYSYGLACSDPREKLTSEERSTRVRHKR